MSNLEKPDNNNNQEQKVITSPEQVFRQNNTYSLQQLHDENKELISHTYTSHRNEQFRWPNAHEKILY
jgi:hypothetical protein